MIEEILKIQAKEMVRYFPKGGLYNGINFPRIIYRHTAWLSLEQTLEAMDHKLMPNLNCGKKPFNMYSKRHQGSLKMFVVYALEYHLDLYLVSTNK
jgi:hypothetical protein